MHSELCFLRLTMPKKMSFAAFSHTRIFLAHSLSRALLRHTFTGQFVSGIIEAYAHTVGFCCEFTKHSVEGKHSLQGGQGNQFLRGSGSHAMVEATSYLSNVYLSEEQGLFQPIESLRQTRGAKPIHSKKSKSNSVPLKPQIVPLDW